MTAAIASATTEVLFYNKIYNLANVAKYLESANDSINTVPQIRGLLQEVAKADPINNNDPIKWAPES